MTLRALYLERTAAGETRATLRDLEEVERPQIASDTVTIDVEYSTLNYKDALAITGISPVVRRCPLVAGVEFAGRVIESRDDCWRRRDEFVLTGWHASETHWGGLAQWAWIPAHWLIRKPSTLKLWETMAIGNAGFTAALCVRAIERHGIASGSGDVLVTGATGGVGSLAIMLLAAAGFRVVASTGKHDYADYLRRLGAAKIIDRSTLGAPGKPL